LLLYKKRFYHQKYFLQRNQKIMNMFSNYSENQFIESVVASKFNGYNKGQNLNDFLLEIDSLYINNDLKENVVQFINKL
jgi:hypothetical protein